MGSHPTVAMRLRVDSLWPGTWCGMRRSYIKPRTPRGLCFAWVVSVWGHLFRTVESWGGKTRIEEVGHRRWVLAGHIIPEYFLSCMALPCQL